MAEPERLGILGIFRRKKEKKESNAEKLLQAYVGKRVEMIIRRDVLDEAWDWSITHLHGVMTSIRGSDVQFLADSGTIRYSGDPTKKPVSPGPYSYQYPGHTYHGAGITTAETFKRLMVEGRDVLPDSSKPKDIWRGISAEKRTLLERIANFLAEQQLRQSVLLTYWGKDPKNWYPIESEITSALDDKESVVFLEPETRDLLKEKPLPYEKWALVRFIEDRELIDGYNSRSYECFNLGYNLEPDGTLQSVEFYRERYRKGPFQKETFPVDGEIFLGLISDSTPESLQDVISRLERKESE